MELDFNKNIYSLDDENNFFEGFNFYFNYSILFCCFFVSFAIDIICNIIEDKEMKEIRNQSFQNAIVDISKNMEIKHRIIFLMAIIAPELNQSQYCVGNYHLKENKTLKNIK